MSLPNLFPANELSGNAETRPLTNRGWPLYHRSPIGAASGRYCDDAFSHLPNALTAARLLSSVVIVALIIVGSQEAYLMAFALFALASATDVLDGCLARHLRSITRIGTFLDPIADKFVADLSLAALGLHSPSLMFVAVLLILRDTYVTALRVTTPTGEFAAPSKIAKGKTLALNAGIGLGLGAHVTSSYPLDVSTACLIFGAMLSILTAVQYTRETMNLRPEAISTIRRNLAYLAFPRVGPFLSVGKTAYFIAGSILALSLGYLPNNPVKWVIAFAVYELVISHGKYLINDIFGRRSDWQFMRSSRNRIPASGTGVACVAAYVAFRLIVGAVVLFIFVGLASAALAAVTVLLQIAYDLVKRTSWTTRALLSFLFVSANFGILALSGAVAVDGSVLDDPLVLVIFVWFSASSAAFLAAYWRYQANHYLVSKRLPPQILAQYKPGLAWIAQQPITRDGTMPLISQQLTYALMFASLLFALTTHSFSGLAIGMGAWLASSIFSVHAIERRTNWIKLFFPCMLAVASAGAIRESLLIPVALSALAVTLYIWQRDHGAAAAIVR